MMCISGNVSTIPNPNTFATDLHRLTRIGIKNL
jgi:hypothetical protein